MMHNLPPTHLVPDPTNTFYFKMDSNSMNKFGIMKGAMLIVDRGLLPGEGSIVVAYYAGEWITRMALEGFLTCGDGFDLPASECQVFGVVTWSCNSM
jgi:SOS-response transcriptional repressor LexA